MTRNAAIRFCDNNFADSSATITGSSQYSATYAVSNAYNPIRAKVWRTGGNFTVTSSNGSVYINDGSDKTVSLTAGDYTYSTLATHVQTQLNASSSGWTVSYDYAGGTYKFTISRSSSGTLRFATTSNAAWDMLGYTQTANSTGTSWVADEQRNHTHERYVIDLGMQMAPTFFAAIGPLSEAFTISDSATCRLLCNNINSWTSPDLAISLDRYDSGMFKFLDDQTDTLYRYFAFDIVDRTNPLGPDGIKLGYIYLGDYTTVTTSNVAIGFDKQLVDPSDVAESESGALYFNRRTKYRTFSNMSIQNLGASERRELEAMFESIGIDTPFFISLDPTLAVSSTIDEYTMYGYFAQAPRLAHVIRDYYTLSFDVREAG